MGRTVILDAGPLWLLTLANGKAPADLCRAWLASLTADGCEIVIPEVADYEVRRMHRHRGATAGIRRLDGLKSAHRFEPITSTIMLRAADVWAQMRTMGRPTSKDRALDADSILVATALELGLPPEAATIATTDGDIERFPGVTGRPWTTIVPDEG
jgi:predicted nucleic acid-binding protein